MFDPVISAEPHHPATVLQVYLLGTVDFETVQLLQRRLVYDVSGDRRQAALILCQHPPIITVGRQGSFAHILCDADEMQARRWSIRWVNRGGGCFLQVPGQLAIYPVLALDHLGLRLQDYIIQLQAVLLALLSDFSLTGITKPGRAGIWLGSRLAADMGIAVRDWVAYHGAVLNIHPALDAFSLVQCGGPKELPMTSIERERHAPLSPALVRQRLIEHFVAQFGFARMTLFTDHPVLERKTGSNALASRSG